ncbi:MAG: hypothetical protein JJE52_18360 [Acidimicrobiia bacterium]|nr:hypothetical protein [Acidimicrobiia bacterium]
MEIPEASFSLRDAGEPPSEAARPYWIYCGGAREGATWIDPEDVVDYDEIARTGAAEYVRDVLGPGLAISTNPASYGLVGMPTWNWVDGWDGQPIAVPTISAFGDSVDITLRFQQARWDFGDGTPTQSGDLGRVYPVESTVQHNYTVRSTSRAEPDGTYTVAATATISATYRLNGGPEIAVDPPLTTTATAPVIIRQAQAVLS